MSQSLNIIIVEKNAVLKSLLIKDFKEEELFKKCGFKKSSDFTKQCEWTVKHNSKKYLINVYAKLDGRAGSENKYDFPPPIDNKLFFGNCAITAKVKNDKDTFIYINLTLDLWEKLYEKLFGGFDDLKESNIQDEEEEDELNDIPKNKKTKQGYLKDGFVMDDSDCNDEDDDEWSDSSSVSSNPTKMKTKTDNDDTLIIEDIGSELSEESYYYSD